MTDFTKHTVPQIAIRVWSARLATSLVEGDGMIVVWLVAVDSGSMTTCTAEWFVSEEMDNELVVVGLREDWWFCWWIDWLDVVEFGVISWIDVCCWSLDDGLGWSIEGGIGGEGVVIGWGWDWTHFLVPKSKEGENGKNGEWSHSVCDFCLRGQEGLECERTDGWKMEKRKCT